MQPQSIPIGYSDGRKVSLSAKRRSTHMHVMGASGQGKSKFLEHCIRQDILAGHGVCLIDPEGDLYQNIVDWMASNDMHKVLTNKKVHLFDPANPDWRFRFNPLYVHPSEKPRHRIDNVIEALAQVWGGEDSRNTPAIRNTIRAILTVLMNNGYSLAEAFFLTSTADKHSVVAYLTDGIDDPIINEIWDGYKKMMGTSGGREHSIEFGGSRRRFAELLGDAEIRETLSAYDKPIDFRECMDNGDIVLINLSPEAMGDDPARAFGALFVRELFYCASRRKPAEAQKKPFFAYIDECAEFMTSDINRILARSRKRGLHVILAHQWLEQLRERGPSIYHGVMGIQNKVIFGGISDEDASILADQLYRSQYDLEIPIASLTKPGVVGYQRIWLNNWSEGSGTSHSIGTTTMTGSSGSAATSTASSKTVAQVYDTEGFPTGSYVVSTADGATAIDTTGQTAAQAVTEAVTESSSSSQGASEAMMPVLENLIGSVHSLESVRHMMIARLRGIPERHAVVKGSASPSFDITTMTVKEAVATPAQITNFTEYVMAESPYTIPTLEAQQILQKHQDRLFFDAENTPRGFKYRGAEKGDDEGLG